MDSRYKNGKIYKITSKHTDKIYIGSTIQKLNVRFRGHRYYCRRGGTCTSKEVVKYEDAVITLIENYQCDSPTQLKTRERFYIENTPNTVNKNIPNRTDKQYREENRENIKKSSKKYREENRENLIKSGKKYREQNIEKEKKRHKKYYLENSEKEKKYAKKYWDEHKDTYKANRDYKNTWCGNYNHNNHNNLLRIELDIFN